MVRPKAFGYDPETALSNVFQNKPLNDKEMDYQDMALSEFDNAVSLLRSNGVKVTIFDETDTDDVKKPDSIFPNNWFSTHSNGMIILYPMMAKSRRLEKRLDVIRYLQDNFKVKGNIPRKQDELAIMTIKTIILYFTLILLKFKELIDISNFAEDEMFLEGTGSIVFDHENKVAYACRSNRTNVNLLKFVCQKLGYSLAEFDAVDGNGIPIYHTNVMMWIGTEVAAICSESIKDSEVDINCIKYTFLLDE